MLLRAFGLKKSDNNMNKIKTVSLIALSYLLLSQQALAQGCPTDTGEVGRETVAFDCPPAAVPEIDGAGAVVAIGLVIGLVALIREKFFRG